MIIKIMKNDYQASPGLQWRSFIGAGVGHGPPSIFNFIYIMYMYINYFDFFNFSNYM